MLGERPFPSLQRSSREADCPRADHGSDTGYRRHRRCAQPVCPAFDEVGLRFGPFDLSFIPIWRGGSLGFVSAIGLRVSPPISRC
jgi:hypothetical protein